MTLGFAPETIEIWPLERLRPYAQNAKTHGPDQVARIAASIAEFGWTVPVHRDIGIDSMVQWNIAERLGGGVTFSKGGRLGPRSHAPQSAGAHCRVGNRAVAGRQRDRPAPVGPDARLPRQ